MTTLRPPSPREHRRRSAFTLLELLTVIAILGILAAILVPVSGRMRAESKSVACANRLRQSGAALLMYAADHKNMINFKAGGSGGADKLWPRLAADYVLPSWKSGPAERAFDIFYCPDYHPFRHDPLHSTWQWDSYGGYFVNTTYAKKETIEEEGGSSWSALKVSLANLPLSTYPMLMDSVGVDRKSQRMSIITHTGSTTSVAVHMRHSGKANAVFYDGHVEALDGPALKRIGFVRGYDRDLNPVNY